MVWTDGENLANTDYVIPAHFGCVFVALVIQHAQRMRRIIWSSLATFFHYLTNDMVFPFKKKFEHKMCVLIYSQLTSITFLILRSNERDTVTNVHRFSCTGCGRNNSHFWRRHCSGYGGGTVMGVVSLISCGLAIFR